MIEGLPHRIHCLGASGAGMLPLAIYLSQAGHRVSAEDDAMTDTAVRLLESEGVELKRFDEDAAAGLVYSSAIAEGHPARAYVERSGGFALRRGECLARVAKTKRLVAISGSHGKTTTCGMLIDLLDTLGLSFDYLLGAQFEEGPPGRHCGSDWLVAEIDESDGTIDLFDPEIAVVLNVDHDHHARYADANAYLAAFRQLAQRTKSCTILEAGLADKIEAGGAKRVTVGEGGAVTVSSEKAGSSWSRLTLVFPDETLEVSVNRAGRVNANNAAFAFAAAREMGQTFSQLSRLEFRSIKRRQRCWYNAAGVQVFEDYAHHPVELASALETFGQRSGCDTVVVFQAHRYSRTRELKEGFSEKLAACQELVLLDVYPASEKAISGGSGEDLFESCRKRNPSAKFFKDSTEAANHLYRSALARPTRLLFLGAGVGDVLARSLSDRLAAADDRWGKLGLALAKVSGTETRILENEPLAGKTTLRVGGTAERYFEPESLDQLRTVVKACHESGLPVWPLGRGSNLVVPDGGVPGLVIRLSHPFWSRFELLDDGRARLGAGLRIKTLCGQAAKEGLEGFEFLEGIPGSLGGVLRMNAGAMGGWIFDVVESIRYVTREGELVEAVKSDLEFGYRYCKELQDAIAVDAVLVSKPEKATQESIRRTIDTYQSKRKETQPREPSAGCIFKNPEGDSAGRLIQELGLKGSVVGGAEVSERHGNFVINRGGATSEDVIELVKLVRKVAKQRRGIELHPEVLLFGSNWEEVL